MVNYQIVNLISHLKSWIISSKFFGYFLKLLNRFIPDWMNQAVHQVPANATPG